VEQDNVELPAAEKDNLIQSISQRLVIPNPVKALRPDAPIDSSPAPVPEASTHALVSILAQIATSKGGQYPPTFLASLAMERAPSPPSVYFLGGSGYTPASAVSRELPGSPEAHTWLENFLNGPNRLFTLVTADEGHRLLEKFYSLADSLDPQELCLLTYVLAAGARYTENVAPHIYLRWIHHARCRFEACASKVRGCQLWVLQPLLLSCLISMHTEPATCWLTLGELQSMVLGGS
jgi:hypothetical protein